MQGPIAITGVGVVSPLGFSVEPLWEALLSGHDLRADWTRNDLGPYPHRQVIEIPRKFLSQITSSGDNLKCSVSDIARFIVNRALVEARIDFDKQRVGCLLASTTSGVEDFERSLVGNRSLMRQLDGTEMLSSPGRMWTGPAEVVSTACSSGLLAPALAADALYSGEAEVMIGGGIDILLEYTVCGFNGLKLVSGDRCRPFDSERRGIVISEGGACFCLEPLSLAMRRHGEVKAVILGYAINCDADNITAPNPYGIAKSMEMALADAGVSPRAIGGVLVHGTGSQANDKAEFDALRLVFGQSVLPPVTAIKSVMGHSQAAAGSFSLLIAIEALRMGQLPPTAGLRTVDPKLDELDVVTTESRALLSDIVMVNAFGFGGNNAVMIVCDPSLVVGN